MIDEIILSESHKEAILSISLFKGIKSSLKESLFDKLDYYAVSMKKGDVVIKQNSPCNHLHVLIEGSLEVYQEEETGNKIKVENIIAPRSFATPHLFNEKDVFPSTFIALEDGILFKATKESVFSVISTDPTLLKNFFKVRTRCNACTVERLKILSHKSIRSRFVFYLITRKQNNTLSIMTHNQTQLAEYLGVTRPAFANEMRKMIEENLIRVEGRIVFLCDYNELIKLI